MYSFRPLVTSSAESFGDAATEMRLEREAVVWLRAHAPDEATYGALSSDLVDLDMEIDTLDADTERRGVEAVNLYGVRLRESVECPLGGHDEQ